MAKKKTTKRQETPDYKKELSDDSFEQLMSESFQPVRSIEVGNSLEAVVIGYDYEHVYLDLGTRLDGLLRISECMEDGTLTVDEGDKIPIFITGRQKGVWLCSRRVGGGDTGGHDANRSAVMSTLEDAFNRNLPVEGKVTEVTKGGFAVEIMGMRAFCPLSQIDIQYCDNPDLHVNQAYTFFIIQFEEAGKNIVVSRREFLANEAKKKAEQLWKKLEEGAVYKGKVTAVQDYGAFIDIGGIEGLLHISEISYERLKSAADVIKVGQELEVAVINLDNQKRKVSLSLKALLEDPWKAAVKKLTVGSEVQGKVVRMKTFGAFIELFPGVDGMVHISRLGTDRRHQHPKEVLKISDTVTVRVMEIDEANRRISLTMEKEEGDYSKDMEKLKKDQEEKSSSKSSSMAKVFDAIQEKK